MEHKTGGLALLQQTPPVGTVCVCVNRVYPTYGLLECGRLRVLPVVIPRLLVRLSVVSVGSRSQCYVNNVNASNYYLRYSNT